MSEWKLAAGSWVVGPNRDRFVDYTEDRSLQEKCELLSQIEGAKGIELLDPYDDFTVEDVENITSQTGIEVMAVMPAKINGREYKYGSLSSQQQSLRKKAIKEVKKTAELARELNCDLVNIWPGQDGNDYLFQVDYEAIWDNFKSSVGEIAESYPDLRFAIEYKPREPRVNCLLRDATKTVLLCEEIGLDNVGLTLDFGHSLIAGENPTEAAAIATRYNRLFHIHLNDNQGLWDDDLMVGTNHFWKTVEFLLYLRSIGYRDWLSLDLAPFREDSFAATSFSFSMIKKLEAFIEKIDVDKLGNSDSVKSYRELMGKLI
ncbi:MAG: sugar phosphate isomerase/epimerase family protein [Halanaerobiales bacterium]